MKRNCSRISARARKHFLQLAAIAFAIGSDGLVATAAEAASADERSAPTFGAPAATEQRRHEFTLARVDAGTLLTARVELIPLARADAFTVDAAGACCIGPLLPGPYALRITQGRQVVNHLLRIDRSTGAFLHFVA